MDIPGESFTFHSHPDGRKVFRGVTDDRQENDTNKDLRHAELRRELIDALYQVVRTECSDHSDCNQSADRRVDIHFGGLFLVLVFLSFKQVRM